MIHHRVPRPLAIVQSARSCFDVRIGSAAYWNNAYMMDPASGLLSPPRFKAGFESFL